MSGVLTGSARLAQEAKETAEHQLLKQEIEQQKFVLERKRKALEAQISALKTEFEEEEAEVLKSLNYKEKLFEMELQDRKRMAHSRKGDA